MPGMDGFETAKRIRAFSHTYLIMLTARADEIDTLQGLQSGADDYVTKPFRPRELRARIEAMLRRPRAMDVAGAENGAASRAGGLPRIALSRPRRDGSSIAVCVCIPAMRLVTVDGGDVELTRSEFDIVGDLLDARGRVVSKAELALLLRGDRGTGSGFVSEHDARAIEVHVANLRRKLGESPARPRWIETVRGVGYRLTAS